MARNTDTKPTPPIPKPVVKAAVPQQQYDPMEEDIRTKAGVSNFHQATADDFNEQGSVNDGYNNDDRPTRGSSDPSVNEPNVFLNDANEPPPPQTEVSRNLTLKERSPEVKTPQIQEDIPIDQILTGATGVTYKGENFYGSTQVRLKRVQKTGFRMNLEKQKGNPQSMPGAIFRWEPDRNGRNYTTGLEDKPELRKRLEQLTGYDLRPDSPFYYNLSYRLEEKEEGYIMNLSDERKGLYNTIVLYAMVAGSLVARSYHQYKEEGKYTAEWYVEDKEAEGNAKTEKIELEKEAFELYSQMSDLKRMNIAKTIGLNVFGLSPRAASGDLWDYLKGIQKELVDGTKTDPKSSAANFVRLAKTNNEDLTLSALIAEAIRFNIIRRNSMKEYEFRRNPLGGTEAAVLATLKQPGSQLTYQEIRKEVDLKLGNS